MNQLVIEHFLSHLYYYTDPQSKHCEHVKCIKKRTVKNMKPKHKPVKGEKVIIRPVNQESIN
jgi:hypothetical protein